MKESAQSCPPDVSSPLQKCLIYSSEFHRDVPWFCTVALLGSLEIDRHRSLNIIHRFPFTVILSFDVVRAYELGI
jgi:hypothetical protein